MKEMTIVLPKSETDKFEARCGVAIRMLGSGTKKATEAIAKAILEESLRQVPKHTLTLWESGFYEVKRRTNIASYRYEAVVGYGGNGDPINPETGEPASAYMVAVHEDLGAYHENGKAKFLEDPVNEFANLRFKRMVFEYAKRALAPLSK